METDMNTTNASDAAQIERIERAMKKKSFCTLATTSPKQRPHVAGVVFAAVGTTLYVHTMRGSRKARNIAANPHAAIVIPVRKMPVGPPFTIQYQASAGLIEMDDPEIVALLAAGKLDAIAGHGALDEPSGCFIRITPTGPLHTYGIGVPLMGVIKDPLHAGARSVRLAC